MFCVSHRPKTKNTTRGLRFYFVLTCTSFWLNVNRYTYFLALALHFLSCCWCCCWCPPLPLLCPRLPFLLLYLMLQKFVIFCYFCSTTFLWRRSATKRLLFCQRRSLEQVGGEGNYLYEKRPRGNFWSIFDVVVEWIKARLDLPSALHPRAVIGYSVNARKVFPLPKE